MTLPIVALSMLLLVSIGGNLWFAWKLFDLTRAIMASEVRVPYAAEALAEQAVEANAMALEKARRDPSRMTPEEYVAFLEDRLEKGGLQ